MMERVDSIVMMSMTGPSIYSDSSEDELDYEDFLSQLLRHTKEVVLAASARGLPDFENV